jgi:hypothetical protein
MLYWIKEIIYTVAHQLVVGSTKVKVVLPPPMLAVKYPNIIDTAPLLRYSSYAGLPSIEKNIYRLNDMTAADVAELASQNDMVCCATCTCTFLWLVAGFLTHTCLIIVLPPWLPDPSFA